mmetsp:Transcript_29709/g.54492  ORF Transcript_29709/g.54492 Transcript_29709/m.54492 type:complete len:241 (+) Transcript_29709:2736-3458(+)
MILGRAGCVTPATEDVLLHLLLLHAVQPGGIAHRTAATHRHTAAAPHHATTAATTATAGSHGRRIPRHAIARILLHHAVVRGRIVILQIGRVMGRELLRRHHGEVGAGHHHLLRMHARHGERARERCGGGSDGTRSEHRLHGIVVGIRVSFSIVVAVVVVVVAAATTIATAATARIPVFLLPLGRQRLLTLRLGNLPHHLGKVAHVGVMRGEGGGGDVVGGGSIVDDVSGAVATAVRRRL